MNKNLVYVVLGILVLVGIWYFIFNKPQPKTEPAVTQQEAASPSAITTANEVRLTLSEQNQSAESGTATLMEVDGKVKVTLNLTGAPDGVTQPAHIHLGKCPDVGAVKYPLTSAVNGASETMLEVTMAQLKSELPLGVNVHKSTQEANFYVACGDLVL